MEQVEKFIHWLNDNIVWGPVMLVLLVGTGIWLTLILRGLQFGMLFYALKQAFRPHPKKDDGSDHEGDVSHFGALMTALSATIGTGNIAGVATAVVTGGPGAVFWMWITDLWNGPCPHRRPPPWPSNRPRTRRRVGGRAAGRRGPGPGAPGWRRCP